MSYSNILFGPEGEQHNTYTTAKVPLGQQLILSDGRKFRFSKNGAGALVAGNLVQSPVPDANWDELVVAAAAAGARTVTITTGSTAVTLNQLAGGYLNIEDDTGEGHLYLIKSHPAASTTASCVLTLASGLKVAIVAATTVGVTKSRFADVIIHPSPPTAALVGFAPTSVAANAYFWAATAGPVSATTQGTLVIGDNCYASATADGAVAPGALTEGTPNTGFGQVPVGIVMEVAVTTENSLILARLDS